MAMDLYRFEFRAMASLCDIQIYASSRDQAQQSADKAIEEVRRIENKYSRYRDDSILSRINQQAGVAPVDIDSETAALLDYAQRCYELSDGLFDITSGVLRSIWDFKKNIVPTREDIQRIVPLIGWHTIARSKKDIFLPAHGMEIDFGGIGKEYATDRAAYLLRQEEVTHGLVNLGGDIVALGPHIDNTPWSIGIRDPRKPQQSLTTLSLSRGALATSGDYERFFEHQGKRYCHIMNPKTGIPVNYWQSVSVIAPVCLAAGSAATITMLKEKKGIDFLAQQEFHYIAIDQKGNWKQY